MFLGVQRHNYCSNFESNLYIVTYYKDTFSEYFLSELNNIRENLKKPCPLCHKRAICQCAILMLRAFKMCIWKKDMDGILIIFTICKNTTMEYVKWIKTTNSIFYLCNLSICCAYIYGWYCNSLIRIGCMYRELRDTSNISKNKDNMLISKSMRYSYTTNVHEGNFFKVRFIHITSNKILFFVYCNLLHSNIICIFWS